MAKTSLTREEAVDFLKNKLEIENIEVSLCNLETLSKIQRRLLSELPFQNISLISTPPQGRFPNIEDVISDGLSLRGGTCVHNNWFAYILLKAFGYDAYPIAAIYYDEKEYEDLHLMVVVRGIADSGETEEEEPIFLFDVASGYPLPAPVPLHKLPIIFPETAGLELCFAKHGEYIYRMHHDRDELSYEKHPVLDGWKVIMKFTLNPRDPASLRKGMEVSFCSDPPGPFTRSTRMFRWPKNCEWAVAMRGYELIFFGKECPEPKCHFDNEKRKHKMVVKENELEQTIRKYYPMICQSQLKVFIERIKEYKSLEEEALKNNKRTE